MNAQLEFALNFHADPASKQALADANVMQEELRKKSDDLFNKMSKEGKP